VFAEANVPETAAGKDLAALARAGAEVGFSSRARGNVREVTMDDQHPDCELNPDWNGKKVNEVTDDFDLSTFDSVIGQAVDDATLRTIHEQQTKDKEDVMDLLKLTAQDWKVILESEQVKKHLAEATAKAVEATKKELEEGFEKQVTKAIKEQMLSDEFAGLFIAEADDTPAETIVEQKCAECEASVPKGAKYCPACGRKVTAAAAATPADEQVAVKDKQIAEQSKQLTALQATVDDMAKRERERQEADVVAEAIGIALEGKPAHITEAVEKLLEDVELTPANVKDLVAKKVTLAEQLAKPAAGNATGTGVVVHNDKDAAPELTEQAKNEQARIDAIMQRL
jgi:hypothetical protein